MKSLGYVISIISVILLAIAAYGSASNTIDVWEAYLAAGVVAAIIGMCLRWYSYRKRQ